MIEHLSRCRSCMSAYGDVVRYRAGWLLLPDEFAEQPRSRGRLAAGWIAAAAVVVVLLGLVTTFLVDLQARRRDEQPLVALVEQASASGLVIPGGEAGAAGGTPLYRSQPVVDDDAERALERLRAAYERRPGGDVRQLAAGLAAAGQLDLAHVYIAEGLERSPGDPVLLILAGIVAHRAGDLGEAERRLRAVLASSPRNLTAMLDLGLVLAESHGPGQAAPYLNEVIQRAPDSALAVRARAALAGN
jgi:tetratricopeptide (TPR) repeat protein